MPNKAAMKKMETGMAVAFIDKDDILICKWVDSNFIFVASTAHGWQQMAGVK